MPRKDRKTVPLFSLNDAVKRGVDRVRQPNWSNPLDHLKIDLYPNGTHGPWIHLYAPFNKECNGRDPVDMLWLPPPTGMVDADAKSFYAYTGPLPDSEEYKADVAKYAGCLSDTRTDSGNG